MRTDRHCRRQFLGSCLAVAGVGLLAGCGGIPPWQTVSRIPLVGYVAPGTVTGYGSRADAFREGMRALGYEEGANLALEVRWAEKEADVPGLAAEVVGLQPRIIVAGGSAAIRPIWNATQTIPIIFVADNADPVEAGYAESYARPGKNLTGLTGLSPHVTQKRLALLKEVVPSMTRVAVLRNPESPDRERLSSETEAGAAALGLQLQWLEVTDATQIDPAIGAASRDRADTLIVLRDPLTNNNRPRIVTLAAEKRLPAMYASREAVDIGGLMTYGPNIYHLYHRTATYVDRILKGAKPGELPIEQPTTFELVVNLRTAQALGLTIPSSILSQATEVIQ